MSDIHIYICTVITEKFILTPGDNYSCDTGKTFKIQWRLVSQLAKHEFFHLNRIILLLNAEFDITTSMLCNDQLS